MSSAGQERSVRALHTAIPGRARFHVPGLKGSRTLKIYLESALSAKRLIKAVSASTATGNMLVLFDRQASLCAVAEAIDELLRKETPRRGELLRPSPVLAWQHMDIARVFRRLRTSMQGLSPEIFQSRFKKYGPNAVPRLRALPVGDSDRPISKPARCPFGWSSRALSPYGRHSGRDRCSMRRCAQRRHRLCDGELFRADDSLALRVRRSRRAGCAFRQTGGDPS